MRVYYHVNAAKEHLKSVDPVLSAIVDSTPYPDYHNTNNLYEDLVSCILDMRIHYAGSRAAFRYKRLKKLIEGKEITPELIRNIDPIIWGKLKLSHQKEESIVMLTGLWENENWDSINWRGLKDKELKEILTRVKGIGTWTIKMIQLFSLEQSDVFPAGDYQLTKAMLEAYGLEENKYLTMKTAEIAKKWSPYSSLAVRYFWKWREEKSSNRR